jgi:hypothetical protein
MSNYTIMGFTALVTLGVMCYIFFWVDKRKKE